MYKKEICDATDLESIGLREDNIGIMPIYAEGEIYKEIRRVINLGINNNQELIDVIDEYLSSNKIIVPKAYILFDIYMNYLNVDVKKEYIKDILPDNFLENDDDFVNYSLCLGNIIGNYLEKVQYGKKNSLQVQSIENCIHNLKNKNGLEEYFNSEYSDDYENQEKANQEFESWVRPFIMEYDERINFLSENSCELTNFTENLYDYNEEIVKYIEKLEKFISQYIIDHKKYSKEEIDDFLNYATGIDPINYDFLEELILKYFSSKKANNNLTRKIYCV